MGAQIAEGNSAGPSIAGSDFAEYVGSKPVGQQPAQRLFCNRKTAETYLPLAMDVNILILWDKFLLLSSVGDLKLQICSVYASSVTYDLSDCTMSHTGRALTLKGYHFNYY